MKLKILLLVFILAISAIFVTAAEQSTLIVHLKGKFKNDTSIYPILELKGRVSEIFTFYDAEYISGLTCRIKYNGKKPLPSKVFFSELDKDGKQIVKKTRLIYPKLNANESGYATFKISNNPSKILIWSEGDGPYETPY